MRRVVVALIVLAGLFLVFVYVAVCEVARSVEMSQSPEYGEDDFENGLPVSVSLTLESGLDFPATLSIDRLT